MLKKPRRKNGGWIIDSFVLGNTIYRLYFVDYESNYMPKEINDNSKSITNPFKLFLIRFINKKLFN
jgi:hypothetical protein